MQKIQIQSLGGNGTLEEQMATNSGILAWKIPWAEDSGGPSPWGPKEPDTI